MLSAIKNSKLEHINYIKALMVHTSENIDTALNNIGEIDDLEVSLKINELMLHIKSKLLTELEAVVASRTESDIVSYKEEGYISGFCDGYRYLQNFLEN